MDRNISPLLRNWDAIYCGKKRAFKTCLISLSALPMMHSNAYAQESETVSTEVIRALSITNLNDLNFGRIIPGNINSFIRLNRNNGDIVTRSGDAIAFGINNNRAEFVIVADPRVTVQITLPDTINLVRVGGTEEMTVSRFRLGGGGNNRTNRRTGNSGILSVFVSAQIRVGANQEVGVYRSNYNVMIEYN